MLQTQYKIRKGIYPSVSNEAWMNKIYANGDTLITIESSTWRYTLTRWTWLHDYRYKDKDMGNWYPTELTLMTDEIEIVGKFLANFKQPTNIVNEKE